MKMFLVGVTVAAAAIGGGIGYAMLKTDGDGLGALVQRDRQSAVIAAEATPAQRTQTFAPDDVVISEAELNDMVADAIARYPQTSSILDLTQGVDTVIAGDRIESGVRINLSDIPLDSLPAEGQQAIEQMTRTFPFLNDRKVYVGIAGSPSVVDGQVSLSNTNVKIGQLKLPIANIASQYGFSQTDIERQLSVLLEQQGLTPEDIRVVDGQLVISGLPQ
ncbi:hypothetical protein [cf. Phormidesmis sp. LEGE 11477]|uniref:hypothetical protein n=1 Tax=cf. Phormidesmis sp. LEGE 11477 TaxID=1828680 RepID=UPI001881ED35|nr:hypothetical protein [cf. Phormidesmis sp. LEGE 11477]MBE9064786.1 hypothetical protein [cf. Phormidesmis sp. LEGE 11477]